MLIVAVGGRTCLAFDAPGRARLLLSAIGAKGVVVKFVGDPDGARVPKPGKISSSAGTDLT